MGRGVSTRPVTGNGSQVHVLFCANSVYFQHMAVAAVSLVESSGPAPICIHVFTCDRDEKGERRLAESLAGYPNVILEVYHLTDELISTGFVDRYMTKEAYLRFLAPRVLPTDLSRVLYLDCDLVVLGDIHELAAVSLGGKAVGAVAECDWSGAEVEGRLADLGIRPGHTYVNSGVLVIDLDRWRRDRLDDRLFAFVAKQGSRLAYYDQDALNAVLQGDIAQLDLRWNLQPLMLSRWAERALPEDHAAARAARRQAGIIHYTTDRKPWRHRVWVRERALYFRFLTRTAWRGSRPPLATKAALLEYDLARSLLRVGIDVYAIPYGYASLREKLFAVGLGRLGARSGRPDPARR